MKIHVKPNDLLIVDRWLDVAYALLWFIYGLWAVTSVIIGLPTLTMVASSIYQTLWSSFIGVLSLTACFLACSLFVETPRFRQISKKRAEVATTIVFCAFVVVYPVLLIVRASTGELETVGATSILAFSYLVFPLLRIHILRSRIRQIRTVMESHAS